MVAVSNMTLIPGFPCGQNPVDVKLRADSGVETTVPRPLQISGTAFVGATVVVGALVVVEIAVVVGAILVVVTVGVAVVVGAAVVVVVGAIPGRIALQVALT